MSAEDVLSIVAAVVAILAALGSCVALVADYRAENGARNRWSGRRNR